jgi:hypothetical protein
MVGFDSHMAEQNPQKHLGIMRASSIKVVSQSMQWAWMLMRVATPDWWSHPGLEVGIGPPGWTKGNWGMGLQSHAQNMDWCAEGKGRIQ